MQAIRQRYLAPVRADAYVTHWVGVFSAMTPHDVAGLGQGGFL
jgi:hypothetical protein